ncbi:Questin oxidase, partial [Lachnellula arida]
PASSTRRNNTMASPSKIHLTINDTGVVKNKPQTNEAATKVSELLQENHDKHHIFSSHVGFHNHIAHHLLTLYGVGAPASIIEQRYAENASHQRPVQINDEVAVEDLHSPEAFTKCLGKGEYYHSFLIFFQTEMELNGWENVVIEYLFAGSETSVDLLQRLYGGFLHPLIHLGFGIEFHQPAIIAEALAQAACHDKWTGEFLLAAGKAANANPTNSPKTYVQLLDEIREDKKLSTAAEWDDGNKIRDGILVRAPKEMMNYATQWVVTPENLEQKTAEMINSSIYFTAAAQHPPKQVKFDFYFMHCVNSSIFFQTFNELSWISTADKVLLLQWKGYLDLAMYASRRSPPLLLEEISTYVPAKLEKGDGEWPGIFQRLWELKDDGHAIKLGRAVRNGELTAEKYGDVEWAKIRGFMWEKIGNMVIDSVEDEGVPWARSVGFDQAWVDYKDRPRKTSI